MPVDYKVDANGYEQVDSALIDGRTVRVGEILSCSCPYEVVSLHLRWRLDTKRVIADHPASGFSYMLRYAADCPVHRKLAKQAQEIDDRIAGHP